MMNIKHKVMAMLSTFTIFVGSASAAINTTQITDAMNAIWIIVDNIGDHLGSIITLVLIGVVIGILYIIKKFLKNTLDGATRKGGD